MRRTTSFSPVEIREENSVLVFVETKRMQKLVKRFKEILDRLFCRKIKDNYKDIRIANIHTPMDEKEEEMKDMYCEELDMFTKKYPKSRTKEFGWRCIRKGGQ